MYRVQTDRRALSQILINLTNNAIKFTEAGFVRLEVAKPGASDRLIELRIIDTGIGIRPEDEEKLFTAFTQVGGGHTGGTGLGLHLKSEARWAPQWLDQFQDRTGQGQHLRPVAAQELTWEAAFWSSKITPRIWN